MLSKFSRAAFVPTVLVALIAFTSISFPKSSVNPQKLKLENVSVRHLDWEQIAVSFEVKDVSEGSIILPEQTMVKVMNAKGKVIAQSHGKRVLLNDAALGSEESLTIELEVIAAGQKLKHSEVLKASKKLMNFNPVISYPIKKQLYAGAYTIAPKFYRQKFGYEGEFELLDLDKQANLFYLIVADERSGKKISLQVKPGAAKFNLNESPQYDDFKPVLESALAEQGGAFLKFTFMALINDKPYEAETTDVHLAFSGAGFPKQSTPKIQMEKIVLSSSASSEMIALGSINELQKHARNYAGKLAESFRVIPEAIQVKINDWKFDASTNLYEAEVAFAWQNTFAADEKYAVRGTLTVDKNGSQPKFQRSYANQLILDVEKYARAERAMASVR